MAAPDPTFLLQDLLSPPAEALQPRLLAQQVVLHLSTIALERPHLALISLLARYTASSSALWESTALSRWDRWMLAYETFRQSTAYRLDAITRPTEESRTRGGDDKAKAGWTARKAVRTYLDEVYTGVWADVTRTPNQASGFGAVDPLIRLAITCGILTALQDWKRRKERLWVGGNHALPRAERDVGRAWREYLQVVDAASDPEAPAWLAAQVIPFVTIESVAAEWPAPALLGCLSSGISRAFGDGYAFSDPPLTADLVLGPSGLAWSRESPSHVHITQLASSPLFATLGSLSRAVGRVTEACALQARSPDRAIAAAALPAIHSLSTAQLAVASRLKAGWAATPWADIVDENDLAPDTRADTAPWTLLKSLLFVQTMVYSSLLEVVTYGREGAGEPSPVQRTLAIEAVRALSETYFVALKFGQSGFPAWRAVLAGLIDIVAAPRALYSKASALMRSPAEELVRSLEGPKGDLANGQHSHAIDRAKVTFWMNTVEQVASALGDSYIEERVLPKCRPYLDDAIYRDTFEAAHSVLLAIFTASKGCANEVAPWYLTLVLRTYPSLLSVTQLRLAYSATVAAVSRSDDALAWWCIEELVDRIESLPVGAQTTTPPALDSGGKEDSPHVSPLDARALTLPRGAYLLSLSALLPSVSVPLLGPLLDHVERLVRQEPVESDGRAAIVEDVFQQVGTGMDAVKRKDATEWWLLHGVDLRHAGPAERTVGSSLAGEPRGHLNGAGSAAVAIGPNGSASSAPSAKL